MESSLSVYIDFPSIFVCAKVRDRGKFMYTGRRRVRFDTVYLVRIPQYSAGSGVKNTEAADTNRKQKTVPRTRHRNGCQRDTRNKKQVEQSIRSRAARGPAVFLCY